MATYYVDNTKSSGTLTGTWTFTNASASVTANADGDAQTELASGDYIRQSDGTQWYKVDGEPGDANTITITPVFQQATHTDDVGASLYNAEAGTAIGTAHCHPQQSVDKNPANGEAIKLRANQTHLVGGAQITLSAVDGTANAPNKLEGCTSADDPWSDGSDVRPIIDAESGSTSCVYSYNGSYWEIRNLECINAQSQGIYLRATGRFEVENCLIHDNGARGIYIYTGTVLIEDCVFYNNTTEQIKTYENSYTMIDGCTFNGGVGGTVNGIVMTESFCVVKNSTFGVTTEHSGYDIDIDQAFWRGHNVTLDSTTPTSGQGAFGRWSKFGDYGGSRNGFLRIEPAGEVSYSVAVERSGAGGSAYSLLGEPDSTCGEDYFQYIIGEWLTGQPLYLDGTEQTVTVYAYCDSTGDAWTLTVDQFVVEIEYESAAGVWSKVQSSDTFADEDQWESFGITLTPNSAGLAYLRVWVADYEAGGKVYVDPAPIFS